MTLDCAHCLLVGKRHPTKIDHIGSERYARYSITIIDGNALCEDHAKRVVADKRAHRGK